MAIDDYSKEKMVIETLCKLTFKIKMKCTQVEKRVCSECNITHSTYQALRNLDSGESIKISDFAHKVGISVSRCSRVIEPMVEKNLIEYKRDENDRRKVEISLTKQGCKIKETMSAVTKDMYKKVKDELTKSELAQIIDSFNKLNKIL